MKVILFGILVAVKTFTQAQTIKGLLLFSLGGREMCYLISSKDQRATTSFLNAAFYLELNYFVFEIRRRSW